MLRLVIPKGSLEQQTLRLFEEADLRVRRGSDRDYHGTIDDERIERVSLLRPQEIPTYVQDGLFDLGIDVHVVWSFGATEAKVHEIVDAIVDITETGSTLRAHGMKVIETLMTSEPVLVANRDSAADPEKHRGMDDIVTLLLGALRAEGRVLIKLNVSEADLAAVLEA